jgi:hypothetical protein
VHSSSPFVPPSDMPAYAEFQVTPETPRQHVEEPIVETPVSSSDLASSEVAAPKEAFPNVVEDFVAEIPVKAPEPVSTISVAESSFHLPAQPDVELPAPNEIEEIAALEADKVPELAPVELGHAPEKTVAPQEEPEFELDQDYELILDSEPLVPAYDQKPPDVLITARQEEAEPVHAGRNSAAPPAGSGFASDQFLADLASEIEHLGTGGLTPSYSTANAEVPVKMIDTSNLSDSGPLKEVFDDFRAELGEMGSDDEDLETHYNLGTAFREMGLLEEAISEFQKVAKANERGRPFRYAMQCCTLLGLAFMEKGQPAIAAIWYERALLTPGVEPESILALRYDLGIAQESAGEPEAALKSFSKVYAMNIDYRDVAERIAALQKPSRR